MYHVHVAKDNSKSEKCRIKGDQMFERHKYFEALKFYNESLCFATNKSKDMALAYENRSVVYLWLEEFEKCLENIKMARDYGYSKDYLYRLVLHEQTCVFKMQLQEAKDDDDPWNFVKLSYPPNEKYPAIANCLELNTNKKYGRHIITNRDLKPGDIIGIEETPFKALDAEAKFIRCANCFKSNKMSLMPLETCAGAMFCSQECLEYGKNKEMCAVDDTCYYGVRVLLEALSTLGGDIDKLELLMKDPELSNKTVFDLDLSNPEDSNFKYNQLLSFGSIYKYPVNINSLKRIIKSHPILNRWSTKRDTNVVKAFMFFVLCRHETSCKITLFNKANPRAKGDITVVKFGKFASSFSSLFNHSCCPNAYHLIVDNKIVVHVTLPIKKGEQIFVSYNRFDWQDPIRERQWEIVKKYNFLCSCAACKNYWKLETMNIADRSFEFCYPTFTPIEKAKEEFANNCAYIQNHSENFPCREILHLQTGNVNLLSFIAAVERYLFKGLSRLSTW